MTTTREQRITRRQAESALRAVERRFASYLEPIVLPADEDGPELVLASVCGTGPELVMDWEDPYDGRPLVVIMWEDGPADWAHRATSGGSAEEDRVLAMQAAEEFGIPIEAAMPADEAPMAWPAHVEAEPYYSWLLVLYPA